MSIEIPGWLKWVGDLIGEPFPEGDEDKTWEQARRWKEFADLLESQKSAIETATRNTLAGFAEGQAHNAMKTEFETLVSGDGSIDVIIKQLKGLSEAVDKTGTEIEFAKEMFIANLAILAATLAFLIASAWWNWGAPVEGAAAVAATEAVVASIIRAAVAKVIEAGASKIVTQLALRALQGAAINTVISAGLNAGIQAHQFSKGHRREFNTQSLFNDMKGGAIAGAVAFPFLHGAKTFDAGSPLANRASTFAASFAGNTGGSAAAQYALTGHVNFSDATMSGLVYGAIDGGFPPAARGAPGSADKPTAAVLDSSPLKLSGDSAATAPHTARTEPAALTGAVGTDRSASVADRPSTPAVPESNSATTAASQTTPGHSATAANSSAPAAGAPARGGDSVAPASPGRLESSTPAATTPNQATTPSSARAGLSSPAPAHPGVVGEPAARVAESAAARPATPAAAAQSAPAHPAGEPAAGRHAVPEAAEPTKATTTHPVTEPAKSPESPSGRHAAPEAAEPTKPVTENNGHTGAKPISPDPQHAAKPDSEQTSNSDGHRGDSAHHTGQDSSPAQPRHPADLWQDAARHSDEGHARAVADDALSRRIPPVEADGLRAPHGSRDQAIARAHDNSDWWHQLSGEEQRALIDTYPREIGNAEGVPPAARHEANSQTLANDRDALRTRQDNGERLTRGEQKYLNRLDELERAIREGEQKAKDAGVGGPYILALDPHAFKGDGRAIVAFGDNPYKAQSVSWHVPGLTTTIDKLATNMDNAFNHLQSTRQEHPGISAASIAWIGYNAPSGLGSWRVAGHGLARVGGDILHSDISAFNLARDLHAGDGTNFRNNHIFGHSYGSTTTSYAGIGGRLHDQVSTVTLLGSPGAGPHRSADGFGIGRENVFVASSSRDWVTTIGGRDTGGRFLGHFGLGRDPAMDTWGGQRITSEFPAHMSTVKGTVGTHTAYYHYVEAPAGPHPGVRSESLANFGRIASGHLERLDFEHHRSQAADAPRWRPGLQTEEPAAGRPLRLDPGGSGREYSVARHGFEPRWRSGDDGGAAPPRTPADGDPRGGGGDTATHPSADSDHRGGSALPHTPADGEPRGGASGPDATAHGGVDLGSTYPPEHVSHTLGLPEYRPGTLDADATRIVYVTGEQRMAGLHEDMVARGVDLETRARTMFETRNELRSWARELMSDRDAAAALNAKDKNYTWAQVIEKYSDNAVGPEKAYERIIEKSMTSRPSVNEKLGIDPHNPPPLPPLEPVPSVGASHNAHSGASPPPGPGVAAVRSELDDDAPAADSGSDAADHDSVAAAGEGRGVTFDDPARPALGSDGKYHLSDGATEVQIDMPGDLGRTITDIDSVENGVLWEEKSATSAGNTEKWVQKQFVNKMEKYIEAQQYIAGFENAPIGVRFTAPGVDPAFRAAVELAAANLREKHPDVTILIDWPS